MNKYQETLDRYDEKLNLLVNFYEDLLKENSNLKRAMSNACEIIAQFDKQLNDEYGGGFKTKEQWKEWLLKDE